MKDLEKKHLDDCREDFTRRRNTSDRRDVAECRKRLDAFLELWPDSAERKNVEEVRDFLNVIQGGVKGKLNIVKGKINKETTCDKPDVFVTVSQGDKELLHTKMIKDNWYPEFNEGVDITWTVDMSPLTFKAIDVDPVMNDELFTHQEESLGFDGYKGLSKTITNTGCELFIEFKPNTPIPDCPWLK